MRIELISAKTVLFVMAASAEYGERLKTHIDPLMTGVGPVEAAVVLTKTLSELAADGRLPDLVVSLGSAGSHCLEQTQIYQASSVGYRDMDASPLGFEKGKTPLLDLPRDVPLPFTIPGIARARLSTGANIVSGSAYDNIDADMVDMETYALMRSCQAFSVPLVALRGISDGKAELKQIDDWIQYLHIIDEKLALAVNQLVSAIETGVIPL